MTISAVLLAGGKSRRMGQDKATLLFRGAPLWRIQLGLLRKLQPRELFVSAHVDPVWRPRGVQFVCDGKPSRGPLSGIAAALAQIKTDHLLTLAIDMPFMSEAYLRDLCTRVEPSEGVFPMGKDLAEPLVAVYPRSVEADFANALSGDDFSLQPLVRKLVRLGKLRPIQVSARQAALFRNLNEPSDLDPG
jgi:molybdopterin-guanine dinucleotide biosynthesis protein A